MSYTLLTEVDRYQIQDFLKAGYSQKAIANELDRYPSTIGREAVRKYRAPRLSSAVRTTADRGKKSLAPSHPDYD